MGVTELVFELLQAVMLKPICHKKPFPGCLLPLRAKTFIRKSVRVQVKDVRAKIS